MFGVVCSLLYSSDLGGSADHGRAAEYLACALLYSSLSFAMITAASARRSSRRVYARVADVADGGCRGDVVGRGGDGPSLGWIRDESECAGCRHEAFGLDPTWPPACEHVR